MNRNTRNALVVLACGTFVAAAPATVAFAGGNHGKDGKKVHKSYACKYVSKPGESERLQTGQNPIWVDNHALLGYNGDTYVGQEFKDGQFRSVVIVANTPKLDPEPGVDQCPPVTPPPSETPTPTPTPTDETPTPTPTPTDETPTPTPTPTDETPSPTPTPTTPGPKPSTPPTHHHTPSPTTPTPFVPRTS